jgi:hypothetical protein
MTLPGIRSETETVTGTWAGEQRAVGTGVNNAGRRNPRREQRLAVEKFMGGVMKRLHDGPAPRMM